MQVAKWGNSLAVRLPKKLVQQLGLKEGDNIELKADDEQFVITRAPTPDEVLQSLRQYRGRLSKNAWLPRDDANAR